MFDNAVNEIERIAKEISKYDNDNELKERIKNDLEKNHRKFDETFQLPMGHKLLIKGIAEYCSNINELQSLPQPVYVIESSSVITEPAKQLEENFIQILLRTCQKYIMEKTYENISVQREIAIIERENDYYVLCPYCTAEIQLRKNPKNRASNFKRHLIEVHTFSEVSRKRKSQKINIICSETLNLAPSSTPSSSSNMSPEAKKISLDNPFVTTNTPNDDEILIIEPSKSSSENVPNKKKAVKKTLLEVSKIIN